MSVGVDVSERTMTGARVTIGAQVQSHLLQVLDLDTWALYS